jgi:galactose mutarotase-like enzyme
MGGIFMEHILENSKIKVIVSDIGGELHGITGKKEGDEYLWNGRPYGWNLSAPTLFPIIGKVKNGEYRYSGKQYKMNQHGFASREEHKVISSNNYGITFELNENVRTLEKYPFKFALRTTYSLEDNDILIGFEVENKDNKEIIFSLGSHPSFLCPFKREEELEDYYLEFDKVETASILSINKEDFLTGEKKIYIKDSNKIDLTSDTFKGGTLIFNDLISNKITLKSKKHNKYVSVEFQGFPFLSLWATENTRPFICIEPWIGHADYDDFHGELREKSDIIVLGK